jgi:hypothetical protein
LHFCHTFGFSPEFNLSSASVQVVVMNDHDHHDHNADICEPEAKRPRSNSLPLVDNAMTTSVAVLAVPTTPFTFRTLAGAQTSFRRRRASHRAADAGRQQRQD